ncbi:MAG: bifunctional oligoribonuclease/PAP phosphatase NrnA [Eubacteriales bacterium]|nr:bifunctional oligoribonuclease/PAP phosphatase NrnA [Eubacteriales bacterium]
MTASNRYQMDELQKAIEQARSVLLFCHVSPDGDTIGSALALKMLLERLQKRVSLVLDGVVPENLFFLPDCYGIRPYAQAAETLEPGAEGVLALAVDVSSVERMGQGRVLFEKAGATAQIDHHETNPAYAQINLIDGDAPATAVLVFRLFEAMGLPIQREEAVCLYTALSTDTGNFVYQSTNAEAFRMMAKLMEAGLPLANYSRLLFRRKARPHVALLGKALPTLRFLCGGEVAGMQVTRSVMDEVGATNEHADGIVDYAIDTSGVRLAYFAREAGDGRIKFSLRALAPYRVDQAAELFGGGGHQLAAGCTLAGPMEEAVRKVEEALVQAHSGGTHE